MVFVRHFSAYSWERAFQLTPIDTKNKLAEFWKHFALRKIRRSFQAFQDVWYCLTSTSSSNHVELEVDVLNHVSPVQSETIIGNVP